MSPSNEPVVPAAGSRSVPPLRTTDVPEPAEFTITRGAELLDAGARVPAAPSVALTQQQLEREIEQLAREVKRLDENLGKGIVGMEEQRRLMIVSPIVGGHIMLDGPPGFAKTLLCKTFAQSLGLHYQRIQFTPDLTANDIIGFLRPNKGGEFEFQPGPIFAHIVLADEINRSPGKTQAALLEAMQEGQVTVDRVTYQLPKPFLVMATQNPLETSIATYPLPDAQLDRVGVKVSIPYPSEAAHREICIRGTSANPPSPSRIFDRAEAEAIFTRAAELVRGVQIEPALLTSVVRIARALNPLPDEPPVLDAVRKKFIVQGPSPRATVRLLEYAKGVALLDGRSYVVADDIHEIAVPVLAHRLQLSDMAIEQGVRPEHLVREAVQKFLGTPTRLKRH